MSIFIIPAVNVCVSVLLIGRLFMSSHRYTFEAYSDTLKKDFKYFCNYNGLKPAFALNCLMFYFIRNDGGCVSVVHSDKFVDSLYLSYPDMLDSPMVRRFSESDLEQKNEEKFD